MIAGLKIIQTTSWHYREQFDWVELPLGQIPPGATRKTHSPRIRWHVGRVTRIYEEPPHVLRYGDTIICTPAQFQAIREALQPKAAS